MRQRDNKPFSIALNNMASRQMSSDDIRLLRNRISEESHVPNDAIHLFTSKQDTDRYNGEKLNSIPLIRLTRKLYPQLNLHDLP